MCLYPSIIENPKYAKSNENSKRIKDYRLRWIQIPCGHCEECRRAKANEWRVRLMEEIKSNSKNIIFATLTFAEESLKKLEYDEEEPNKAPQKAEAKMLEVKKRTEEATADLRELQYWTEIANTIIKLAQVVGNLTYRDWENRKTDQRIHGKKDERNTPQEFNNSNTTLQSGNAIQRNGQNSNNKIS